MKNSKKKNDKVIILLIVLLVCFVLSWIIKGGTYNSGVFSETGYTRAGLYDIIAVIYSAFYYRASDIFYILTIGGMYGVLSKTNMYRKLVDKTSDLIEGKETIAFAIVTLLIGLYVSITNQLMAILFIVPFIVSVFLRNGQNRITAMAAGFGGMFIGYMGMTYGSYAVGTLNNLTGIGYTDWILSKIVVFVVAYVLFNLFAILYMKKSKKVDETKYDMFCSEELDETKVKKRKRTKIWPLLLVMGIASLIVCLGYISWMDSFGVKTFSEIYTSIVTGFEVGGVPLFGALLGDYMREFGEWANLLYGSFVLIIAIIIVGLINKVGINEFIKNFGSGMKKIGKVAFIYGLASIVVFFATTYPWQYTVINTLFGNGTFNIFTLLLIAIIAQVLLGDLDCFFLFGSYLSLTFADNIIAAGLIWRIGSSIALIVGPTSFLLLSALTYLDVPYLKWLKYIWKFVLSFMLLVLIILAVVIYV